MTHPKRRRFVPEVVQSSGMDCGPAALKAYLEGHGVSVSYGRLREACQTDVDGTLIETLEGLAGGLGVPVEQVILPKDVALLDEAETLPAIAVMRLPNGNTHFAVVWNHVAGHLYQVMDPAAGRRWLTRRQLDQELFEHTMSVSSADWRDWAASEESVTLLRARLSGLDRAGHLERALADPTFHALAALDAAARAVRALRAGRAGAVLFEKFLEEPERIPGAFWSVRPADESGQLVVKGAVFLRPAREPEAETEKSGRSTLPKAVAAARDERPERTLPEIWRWLRPPGALSPVALFAAFLVAGAAIVIEALLFRSVLELAPLFGLSEYRIGIVAVLVTFMLIFIVVDLSAITGEFRLGRRLETRLRIALQSKLPKLGDRYFSSRLTSDMAERQHSLHQLRVLPRLAGLITRTGFELLFTTAAIIWLAPETAPIVVTALVAALVIPLIGLPLLHERDLRVRSHVGALSRFYLDGLLGLVPLRVHGAAPALAAEHEGLCVQWAGARLGMQRAVVFIEASQFLVGYGLIVWLLLHTFTGGGEPTALLLLAYWALNLPVLGLRLVQLTWRYPEARNVFLRVTEPLSALEETDVAPPSGEDTDGSTALRVEGASVSVSGHTLLSRLDVSIAPGSHVAIIGPSGAGKTSLFGLLLGWHFPDEGRVLFDGSVISRERLAAHRAQTAWVDASVHLWNRSLGENLRYGNGDGDRGALSLPHLIEQADLLSVLEMLPDGHRTRLGEGGALVSGGEGQRVRLARAFLRPNVRLVLLDEPFRGVDREKRRELLRRARELWAGTTLLCITHDVEETLSFERVLVIEGGRVSEDGAPRALVERDDSRYRHFLESERALTRMWSDTSWQRWELSGGRLHVL